MVRDKRSGYRTLLLPVLLSAPGPLVLGLGLMVGHSSTQISDFTRRTAELERKGNTFVGIIMCISGLSMIIMAMPGTKVSFYIDTIGSVIVSLYMIYCGICTIKEFN